MMKPVPLARPSMGHGELEAVRQVLRSGWLVQGPRVAEFEALVSRFTALPHAVAVSSCTSALYHCLRILGVGSGDDVLVPAFTFVATANSVVHAGGTPVFVDIDLATFNISRNAVESRVRQLYTRRAGVLRNRKTGRGLRYMLVVHQFGLSADMAALGSFARDNRIVVVEDAACAFGTHFRGRHVGSFGVAGCLSFHPRKSITTGEGGMVITRDSALARKVRMMRDHGARTSDHERHRKGVMRMPEYPISGFNSRMTDLQGALGVIQIRRARAMLTRRDQIARRYLARLQGTHGLVLPSIPGGCGHSWQSFVVRIPSGRRARNAVAELLKRKGISTRPGTHALPWLGAFRGLGPEERAACPNAREAEATSLSLPLFVGLSDRQVDLVASALRHALNY